MVVTPRKHAKAFDPHVLALFDAYVHGTISRESFISQASRHIGAGTSGDAILAELEPDYSLAQTVRPDDPDIQTLTIEYESPRGHGTVRALMAAPADQSGPLPAVLVVHENRGLNPYIEDVVRRLAKAGYLALGPDGLTSVGGYPGNDDDGRRLQRGLDPDRLNEDFFAGFEFLRDHPRSTGRVGCVGFCYGGGICNQLAVTYPDLAASVPFYGRQPADEAVPAIQAPLLIHYAELDERINAGWDAYRTALEANGKTFTVHVYPDVHHGFHNDATPRFDEDAAAMAWTRTLAFLGERLRR